MASDTSHPLAKQMLAFVRERQLFSVADNLIVAISGGLDSVVLTHLLLELGHKPMLAHANFQLRGEESMRDEAFVRQMAATLGLQPEVMSFDTASWARDHHLSVQEAARQLRYDWLAELCRQHKPQHGRGLLLTAHHADDHAETLMHNLFRGGGLQSLSGIPVKRDHIVRPLLFASRSQLEEYAAELQLAWVEDSSNNSTRYTRNLIRHTILPAIEQIYPAVRQNLVHTAGRVSEALELYREALKLKINALTTTMHGQTAISIRKLLATSPLHTVVYELFKAYGFTPGQVAEVIKLTEAVNGSWLASETYRLIRHNKWLLVVPLEQANSMAPVVIESMPAEVPMGHQMLRLEIINAVPDEAALRHDAPHTLYALADNLSMPLVLRPWRSGDYLYPLGMAKKKKVARLLIDIKMPLHEKEQVRVLESNQRIIALPGLRLDNRFKVVQGAKQVLKISVVQETGSPRT